MKTKNILRAMAVVVLIGLMVGISQSFNNDLANDPPISVDQKTPSENQGTEQKPVIEKITEIPS
ncbi:MAG: hypothetical protein Q4D77_00655 [Peptostreptococcaceae bacterium]|nr:hypothetical protein [Peptostreptococcaceae bacterium]